MGILQSIRTKIGIGAEVPDSQALARALEDLEQKVAANREQARALKADLPTAVISSIDSGKTQRDKLTRLESEFGALATTLSALREERILALDREAEAKRGAQIADLREAEAEFLAVMGELSKTVKVLATQARAALEKSDAVVRASTGIITGNEFNPHEVRASLPRWLDLAVFAECADESMRPRGCVHDVSVLRERGWSDLMAYGAEWVTLANRSIEDSKPEPETHAIDEQPGQEAFDAHE